MSGLLIGYARVSTEEQDLTAQREGLAALGVEVERIYVDHGLTGTNRERPGLREALAACRAGDTLVVTKLDRLARSLPDARAIAEDLTKRKVRLSLGASVYDPTDPVGRLLFNVLAMVAEFEGDLIRSRTREGMRVAKAKGHLRGKQPKLNPRQEAHLVELLNTGEYTTSEVGDLFGVARSTIYRAVVRSKHPTTSAAGRTNQKPRVVTPPAASAQVAILYRPRHGEPSDLPSENRTRRSPRKPRPEPTPWVLAVIATPSDWVLSMSEYSIFVRPDLLQRFWQVMSEGGFISDAVAVIDTSRRTGRRVLVDAGGVRPRRGRDLKGRCLTFVEREEIALARAGGESMRSIAERLGRSASTVSRELKRNVDRRGRYRSTAAHAMAYERAGRPKPAKLVTNLALREKVEKDLEKKYSPEQIVGRLLVEFPDDPEMRVSAETIYQSIYVQSRGALRRDLAVCLRTGRALRRPSRKVGQRKNRIPNMINVSERPAEVEDRAVPGNWEGDLIIGKQNQTAIGTLVERQTGYAMLLHLPDGYKPEQVRDALAAKIKTLPESLRLSLTWDQGPEMRDWKHVSIDTGIDIYFCDPHSPWQRGTNENFNGLLRQYFPKGTDLSIHSADDLDWVAQELNDRPRKRLAFQKPIELIGDLLLR